VSSTRPSFSSDACKVALCLASVMLATARNIADRTVKRFYRLFAHHRWLSGSFDGADFSRTAKHGRDRETWRLARRSLRPYAAFEERFFSLIVAAIASSCSLERAKLPARFSARGTVTA
jgi:hypothetical protein